MTYEEFKSTMEENAMDNDWFFSIGMRLIEQYPKFADKMFAESLRKETRK